MYALHRKYRCGVGGGASGDETAPSAPPSSSGSAAEGSAAGLSSASRLGELPEAKNASSSASAPA